LPIFYTSFSIRPSEGFTRVDPRKFTRCKQIDKLENHVSASAASQDTQQCPNLHCTLPSKVIDIYSMPGKIRTALKVDFDKPASEQPGLHNRWHPDVPFCGTIKNGETVKIECLDWTGGQIKNDDSADDILNVDLTRVHYLSGPFEIEEAEPGDVLLIEIMDVQPFQDQPWGFTGVFHKENGGGFLDEIYPDA